MRALLQRVTRASVDVDGQTVGEIGHGWLALVGVGHGDTPALGDQLADKIAQLRCFEDAEGKTNLSILDVGGQVLLVTAIVDDPRYLQTPFIVSSQFKKEVDGSKWDPTPCLTNW